MTRKHVQWLAAAVVGLVLVMFVLETGEDTGPGPEEGLFLPGFAADANGVTEIRVKTTDAEITLRRGAEGWVVASSGGYPADLGTLRQLILALAEARIVEEKTANPDFYDRLGVDDPEADGSGTKLSLGGEGIAYALILGETAQGEFRYARVADAAQSVLIDRSPEVPDSPGDWLVAEVVDIPATRVRRVTIAHADGETIAIEKDTEDQTDFTVLEIPEGRELSYATVANGIGGALGSLELSDVRKAVDAEADATATFETWDGLRIVAAIHGEDEATWASFAAEAGDAVAGDPEQSGDPPGPTADGINARVAGWQYELPEYKKNLLIKRWDDLLRAAEAE